jgi:hypothetical protein
MQAASRLKRETLVAVIPPEQITSIRELVSFRARPATIAQLVPHQYAEMVIRRIYETSALRPPGGTQPSCKQVILMYRSLTYRSNLNALYTQFSDLRGAGVSFESALVIVYRLYRRKAGFGIDEKQLISFDHWYVIALEIETRESRLHRCGACGSRNLLTKHISVTSIDCVFCDLLAAANRKLTAKADSAAPRQAKVA